MVVNKWFYVYELSREEDHRVATIIAAFCLCLSSASLDVAEKKKRKKPFNIHMFHFALFLFCSMCMFDTFHLNQNQILELNTC